MLPLRDSQPHYTRPVVTTALVGINVLIFLFQLTLDEMTRNDFVHAFGLVPDRFHVLNLLTSMFMHGGWLHLIGNMMFLWVLGDNIEDILGHAQFLVFYVACGVAAGLAQYAVYPDSRVPMIGASGAIAGVMGAYLIKFPHARIEMVFWFIVVFFSELPAWLMLIYWFGLQFFNGVGSVVQMHANSGGTAWFAHIGGFVAGMVLILVMKQRDRYLLRRDMTW
jgi:membrane associated rhomboid family serine protease